MKTVQLAPTATLKQRVARFGLGLGLAATMTLGAVMPTLAAPGDGTVVLSPGALTSDTPAFTFAPKTLTGVAQTTTASAPITIVDATGSSAGWYVTMNMGAFTGSGGTLVAAPRVTAAALSGGASNSVLPATYTAGINVDGTAATIGGGTPAATSNGTFTLTPTIEIDIPANTVAGTYTSAAVVTVAATP